jgi:hypothetical protein
VTLFGEETFAGLLDVLAVEGVARVGTVRFAGNGDVVVAAATARLVRWSVADLSEPAFALLTFWFLRAVNRYCDRRYCPEWKIFSSSRSQAMRSYLLDIVRSASAPPAASLVAEFLALA